MIKFNIRSLFVLTLIAACLLALLTSGHIWLIKLTVAVLIINLLGMGVGMLITHGLKFPTDGGYRDPELRAEQQPSQAKPSQAKTSQDKPRQAKTSQDKTRQDKTRQDKPRQDKTKLAG